MSLDRQLFDIFGRIFIIFFRKFFLFIFKFYKRIYLLLIRESYKIRRM